MQYFVGIDGGGSKTKLLCMDREGKTFAESDAGSTYYRQDGVENVIETLRAGLEPIFSTVGREAVCVCFGMPGFGENKAGDEKAAAQIAAAFAPVPICFENDVACGWAGALALSPGVSIVGGTGSMSYGRDARGHAARSGGWSEFFSDEGSGYWLGKKMLELFARQSDGRAQKGPLYGLVREHFSLDDDYGVVSIVEKEIAPSRKHTAELQMVLLKAARDGDAMALQAYAVAAEELAHIVCGCAAQLDFEGDPVHISYVGGLFKIEDLILEPMEREIRKRLEAVFQKPLLSPCEGAILFSAEAFAKDDLPGLREKLLQKGR